MPVHEVLRTGASPARAWSCDGVVVARAPRGSLSAPRASRSGRWDLAWRRGAHGFARRAAHAPSRDRVRPLPRRPLRPRTGRCATAAEGRSNREIARARGGAERTVANQLAATFVKLGVGSRAELCARWYGTRAVTG
ncbi:MAG: response regulator transcription factor [Myxococcales bacterium]|nr:response regulator transcription factor [Myxococcales bacterium]